MAIIMFIIPAISGILGTSFVLKYLKGIGKLNKRKYSLIFSIGMALTWASSFLFPLLAPGTKVVIDSSLVTFIIGQSIIISILAYIISRILLKKSSF